MQKQIIKLSFFLTAFLIVPNFAKAATYYVCDTQATCNAIPSGWGIGNNSNAGTLKSAPKKTISAAVDSLSAGDTLIIGDGVYIGVDNMIGQDGNEIFPPSGIDATHRTTIMAEHIGQAIIDGEYLQKPFQVFDGKPRDYLHIDGIHFRRGDGGVFTLGGNYNYVSNCGFEDGGNYDGEYPIASVTQGAYILVEDCWVWGYGRYGLYTGSVLGGTNHVIFRRVVVRLDDTPSWMTAGLRFYKAQNNAMQNCVVIDNNVNANAGEPYAITQGGGSSYTEEYNHIYVGNIALNNPDQDGFGNEDGDTIETMSDNISWDNMSGIKIYSDSEVSNPFTLNVSNGLIGGHNAMFGTGTTSSYRNNTTINLSNSVIANTNGYAFSQTNMAQNLTNVVSYGNINNTVCNGCLGTPIVTNPFTSAIKYLPRHESGTAGPTIMYQIGEKGTYYDQTGWNTTTTNQLWPFPNEAMWSAKMKAYTASGPGGNRGFAALSGSTETPLTDYIWGYLGTPKPVDMYGSTDEIAPSAASGLSVQ